MNKIINQIISFIAVAVMVSSCDRNVLELPDSSGNDPVFRLSMNLDNSDLEVVAGIDEIYNHTDFDLDQDEVYTFEGLLSSTDCDKDCPNSYRFKFRNYETGTAVVSTNQSLSVKSYDFKYEQAPTQDAFELRMDIINDVAEPEFTWTINGQTSSQEEVSDILLLSIADTDIAKTSATLEIRDKSTGLKTSTTKQVYLEDNTQGVNSFIKVTKILEDSIDIEIVHTSGTEFSPLSSTLWTVADLDGQNPFLPDGTQNKFSLRLGEGKSISNFTAFLSNTSGTETKSIIDIAYDSARDELIYHDADFNYTVEKRIAEGSDLALQSFEFELYDEAGVLFSSAKGEQAAGSYFEITDKEEYIENDMGQKTYKVSCRFSCQVFSESGESKTITDANAVIAVAIP